MFNSVVKASKDDHTRRENLVTQPLVKHRVFNNPDVLTEGWYPITACTELKTSQVKSFLIFKQRIVVFRGDDGVVRALDAFCPHMGADLGNGRVINNEIQCYFHQWKFSEKGLLTDVPCQSHLPKGVKVNSYPVEEKFGFIWVYSASEAPYPVPNPPGFASSEEHLAATHLKEAVLYAHHHVMMANGIDLQHFSAVHNLDVEFNFEVEDTNGHVFEWNLEGEIPDTGLKNRFLRWLLGPKVGYKARFAGGSIVSLTYGPNQRFRGTGFKIPALHILWGCVPRLTGVSHVHIFIVTHRTSGLWGWIKSKTFTFLTIALLIALRDDDIKAFPHMRFNPKFLLKADKSVARFIQLTEKLRLSTWSGLGRD